MSVPLTAKPIEILLVEDNPGDIRLTIEALKEGKVTNNLHVVMDGEQALQFLRHEAPYADVPRPDILLLDLNLPKKDGREVLKEIKSDPDLRRIPVAVLTTSKAEEDICRAYDLNCNCYINKPVELGRFLDAIKALQEFWLTVVTLPPKPPNA